MTSFVAPRIVGISEKAVAEYRALVAPWNKNKWNRLSDFLFHTNGGLAVCIGTVVLFACAMLFGGSSFLPTPVATLCVLPIIFVAMFDKSFGLLMTNPPVWGRSSIIEYLEREKPHTSELQMLQEVISAQRLQEPAIEFEVEYLMYAKEQPIYRTVILWAKSALLDTEKRHAVLIVRDGKRVDLADIAGGVTPVIRH